MIASKEEIYLKRTRVNLRWKGGHRSLPMVKIQNLSLEIKLTYSKLLELNLITPLMLELLNNLVTQF